MQDSYTPEQREFLDKFYNGVTDPEIRFSMLIEATGGGTVSFHATGMNTEGKLQGFSDSEILLAAKIACVEHDLLVFNQLLTPELY